MRNNVLTPNFLGIGAPRCGTTWLHFLLSNHNDVLMPKKRKELQFFNKNYDKGYDWYLSFFEKPNSQNVPSAIGEITPGYFFDDKCPKRINQFGKVKKFILILRNPVDRTISHYRHHLRVSNENTTFNEFVKKYKRLAIRNSQYARNFCNYLKYFNKNQFLVLIYENVFKEKYNYKNQIADFLEISTYGFGSDPGIVNKGTIPKYRTGLYLAKKAARFFRERQLDIIPNIGRKIGVEKLFGKSSANYFFVENKERIDLYATFEKEICDLESILNIDLTIWKE